MHASRVGLAIACACLVSCAPPPPDTDAGTRDVGPRTCASDRDCDDGAFCNGPERCMPGNAMAGIDGCVSASPPCPSGTTCNEMLGRCVTSCAVSADADGDGATAIDCGGNDCDDTDAMRRPGLPEVCDAMHDEDCDPRTVGTLDMDGDGQVSAACCNADGAAGLRCGPDCDDARPAVRAGGTEVCNMLDDDCDHAVDEGVQIALWPDADHDLFGANVTPTFGCMAGPDTVQNALDCRDDDATIHPGAAEVCDGADNECDGVVDDPGVTALACAATYGSPAFTRFVCRMGNCVIDDCTTGYLDCDHRLDDGCETESQTSVANCGTCGLSCGAVGTCTAGVCDPIVQIEAGLEHTCIVRESGVVACWGRNTQGELGDRTYMDRRDPVRVVDLPVTTRVAPSTGGFASDMTCATGGQTVVCWGDNTLGQLGDGTRIARLAPTPVVTPTGRFPPLVLFNPIAVRDVAASGFHSCAITEDRMGSSTSLLWCWGLDGDGQCGRGGASGSVPVPVATVSFPVPLGAGARVVLGQFTTCVKTDSVGQVWCMGGGVSGALGNGSTVSSPSFVQAGTASDITRLDGAGRTFCSVSSSGRVACWGLGFDGSSTVTTPTAISLSGTVVDVAVGMTYQGVPYACALRSDGTVACWGGNDDGNLGRGTGGMGMRDSTPADVMGLGHAVELTSGGFHVCARLDDGSVWCWGDNHFLQLGHAAAGTFSATPVQVDQLPPYLP